MRARVVLVFTLFFCSGIASLIYQVVWSRLLTLVIGVSIFAITTVICTYMAGLALGSWAIGRWGERWGDPLRVYAVLEAAIGLYAALTPWLFEAIEPVYVWAFQSFEGAALDTFRVVLSGLVLLVPTVLMGGTLPLLSRAVSAGTADAARSAGRLYAVNTFGAVLGCIAAGFVLLAEVGIRGSLFITAVLNLAIAAVALAAPRAGSEAAAPAPAEPEAYSAASGRFVLAVFLVSGFAALGYEVLWTRALLVYVKASTYAFSLMLAVYLVGIAIGSSLAAGLASRSRQPLAGLAACQVGVALTVLLSLMIFPDLDVLGLKLVGSDSVDSFGRAVALMFAQASVALLLPTIFMGAMFPFGVAAYHHRGRNVGRSVGSLYAVNTAGNIAGSIGVGFFAISLLGVRNSMVILIGLNLALAACLGMRLGRSRLLGAALAAGAALGTLGVHWAVSPQLFFDSLYRSPSAEVIYYREGASDTVAVVEGKRPKPYRVLIYSDGRGAAGTSSLQWNLYLGHLPMLLHDDPQEILHICYGSGNSVLALTRHDPERIDVIELSPHVRDASPYFWTNEGVLEDPRVNLVIEDGRNFLMGTGSSYDVISLEPPSVHTAGVVNLYTQDFYTLALEHLKPGGIFLQWLPTGQLGERDRRHLVRAFTEAFPHVYTWQQLIGPVLLLMGTVEPLSVDVDEVERRLRSEAMASDLRTMGIASAEGFLSFFLLGDASTRAFAAGYEPVRDDRTIVDYTIPHFVGSGFGVGLFTYPTADGDLTPKSELAARIREYAEWADPAGLIVPDAAQARRVDAAMQRRQARARRMAGQREQRLRRRR